MDKFCGANTPRGVEGQEPPAGDDFEVHPVGTAERLRRLGLIGPLAVAILESQANTIFEAETVDKEAWETCITVAAHLRALCTPPAAAPPPEAKPDDLPDEDFTIPIYP